MIIDEIMVIQKRVHAETRPNTRNYLYTGQKKIIHDHSKTGFVRKTVVLGFYKYLFYCQTLQMGPNEAPLNGPKSVHKIESHNTKCF